MAPEALKKQVDRSAPDIQIGTASGQPQTSSDLCKLDLTGLPKESTTSGHVKPGFQHNLLGIGECCDTDCKGLINKKMVPIFHK